MLPFTSSLASSLNLVRHLQNQVDFKFELPSSQMELVCFGLLIQTTVLSTLQLLLDNGADVNALTIGLATPLHVAATEGRADVVQVLKIELLCLP